MAKGIKICKVCGREYESCHTLRPNLNSEFRWQDVACCPEHGQEYLRLVLISRGKAAPHADVEENVPASDNAADTAVPKQAAKKRRVRKAVNTAQVSPAVSDAAEKTE